MTMRLTPNKIVAFSIGAFVLMAIQNRMQSRVLIRQVDEMKHKSLEEQLNFRNKHAPTGSESVEGSQK